MHDEWVTKAFELAYFIHGDKETATGIVTEALSKLEVAASAQYKRLYYTPRGRSGSSGTRTKVSLGDLHLLQRLIYIESEPHERHREVSAGATVEDMVKHFVKHLVRITLRRNSFYVTLGIGRLLHNYSTSETMEIYNVVAQDPDRVRDDYYYRSRKRRLLEEIMARFAHHIRISRGIRGEERFEAVREPGFLSSLVYRCLEKFTPWNTTCEIPPAFDPSRSILPRLGSSGRNPDEGHFTEVPRLHSVLHPECFRRLVQGLRMEVPERRLEIPVFAMSNGQGTRSGPSDHEDPPNLSSGEIQTIRENLHKRAARRKTTAAGLLMILVDGIEHVRLDVRQSSVVRFDVAEGAELLEVRSVEPDGKTLLATHLLSLDREDSQRDPLTASIVLEGGQKLALTVRPSRDASGNRAGAAISLQYQETTIRRAWLLKRHQLWSRLMSAQGSSTDSNVLLSRPALTLAVMAMVILSFAFFFFLSPRVPGTPGQSAEEKIAVPAPEQSPPPQIVQALPRAPVQTGSSDVTRSVRPDARGMRLSQVKSVYIEPLGTGLLAEQVQDELKQGLEAGSLFQVSADLNRADAVFRGSVEPAGRDGRVTLRIRLINSNGEILWSTREQGEVGSVSEVSRRAVDNLSGEIKR